MEKVSRFFLIVMIPLLFLSSCGSGRQPVISSSGLLNMELELLLEEAGGTRGMVDFLMPTAEKIQQIPSDPLNPITEEKVNLGKHLYHETGLAVVPENPVGMFTYSCASCHHAAAGFQANLQQGIGEGGWGFGFTGESRQLHPSYSEEDVDVQPLRTPTALNVAFQSNMLWNGQFGATGINKGTEAFWTAGTPKEVNFLGYEGVEIQAIAGLGVHRLDLDQNFVFTTEYKKWFDDVFPEVEADDRYTREFAGLAIAAYERTLLANEAPFQRWLRGEEGAMTDDEKEGAILFFGKGKCGSCHKGPALNEMNFYAYGMNDMEGNGTIKAESSMGANKGRGDFTGQDEDLYKFKVPQLYNLKDSPFYGHGGTFRSVKEVVQYKNRAVKENPNVPDSYLATEFQPLGLTDEEIDLITIFIEEALYDPNLDRYVPESLPSGFCFPNNDPQAIEDQDCDK